jgi:hypothetical protein
MMGILQSQKLSDFHIVLGLYLVASGASKREVEVMAHAGICLSYSQILQYINQLSAEGEKHFCKVIHLILCGIVWDNLNIAFKIGEQWLRSAAHFDNGTTATLIPIYDPITGQNALHGTLPLSMKKPRTSCRPIVDFDAHHTDCVQD